MQDIPGRKEEEQGKGLCETRGNHHLVCKILFDEMKYMSRVLCMSMEKAYVLEVESELRLALMIESDLVILIALFRGNGVEQIIL